jgi:DNA repair exonuclease SbcCD nuclease subunit
MANKKPIALITSDWHLAKSPYLSLPHAYIQNDAFRTLEFAVQTAQKYEIPIIAAGDTLDSKKPTSYTISRLLDTVVDVKIYFIQGQHEYSDDSPWLSIIDNAEHISEKMITIGSHNFYGLDWQTSNVLKAKLAAIEDADVLILHQTCKEPMFIKYGHSDRIERIKQAELDHYMLPESVKYAVVGDTHLPTPFTIKNTASKQVPCLSPGSFMAQAINELDYAVVWLMYDDLSVQPVQGPKRNYICFEIKKYTDYNDVVKQLEKLPKLDLDELPLIRINITTDADKDYVQQICDMVGERYPILGHLFIFIRSINHDVEDVNIDTFDTTEDLVSSALLKYAEQDQEAAQLLQKLTTAESPDITLAEAFNQFKQQYQC